MFAKSESKKKSSVKKVETPPKPVTEFFRPAEEIAPIEGLKILVWGETNTGKTHFALTAPRPTFVIDTEFGTAPIKHKFDQKDLYIAEIAQLDPVTKEIDLSASVDALEEALRAIIAYIEDNPDVKGTIVIDSISDVWDWLGIWLVEDAAELFTKTGLPQKLEWGKANRRYYKMILKLLRSKWNVVATAKSQEVYDETGRATGKLKPKMQKNTEFWFDIIMRAELIDPVKKIRKFTITKFRSLDTYTSFTNPSWDDIVNFIQENLGIVIK